MKLRLLAFSLAEMLVAMLVVAIILALSAPMITKKLSAGASSAGLSPWRSISGGSVVYNPKGKPITVLVGAGEQAYARFGKLLSRIPRLTVASNQDAPHIGFIYNNVPKASLSVANGIAFGHNAVAVGEHSVAIGYNVMATKPDSFVFGVDAKSLYPNSITFGNNKTIVSIPGTVVVSNLVVDNNATLSPKLLKGIFNSFLSEHTADLTEMIMKTVGTQQPAQPEISQEMLNSMMQQLMQQQLSDIRLKDIIGENLDSLEKIERLKVYDYTFKDDKAKTKRVGVVAQDLKKVFPDAVSKNKDGYLQIRNEDIFYAMLNAVKELNRKSVDKSTFEELVNRVEAQEKELDMLRKEIENLKKQVAL